MQALARLGVQACRVLSGRRRPGTGTASHLTTPHEEAGMYTKLAVNRSRIGAGHVLALALLSALTLAAPRALRGAETEETLPGTEARLCSDKAWADYNSCLMESDGWFHRKVCDLAFQADYAYCLAVYAGKIKEASNPAA
jgi:hypothetical protein